MEQPAAHAHHTPAPPVDLAPRAAHAPQDPALVAPSLQDPAQAGAHFALDTALAATHEAAHSASQSTALVSNPDDMDLFTKWIRGPKPSPSDDGIISLGDQDLFQALISGNASVTRVSPSTITVNNAVATIKLRQATVQEGTRSIETLIALQTLKDANGRIVCKQVGVGDGCIVGSTTYTINKNGQVSLNQHFMSTDMLCIQGESPVTGPCSFYDERRFRPDGNVNPHEVVSPPAIHPLVPQQLQVPTQVAGTQQAATAPPASAQSISTQLTAQPASAQSISTQLTATMLPASTPVDTHSTFVVLWMIADQASSKNAYNVLDEGRCSGSHLNSMPPEQVAASIRNRLTGKLNNSILSSHAMLYEGKDSRVIMYTNRKSQDAKRLKLLFLRFFAVYTGSTTPENQRNEFFIKDGCPSHKMQLIHEKGLGVVQLVKGVLDNSFLSEKSLQLLGEDWLSCTERLRTKPPADPAEPKPVKSTSTTAAGKRTSKYVDASDDELDYDSDGNPRRRKKDNDDPDSGPKRKRKAADPTAPPSPAPLTRSQVTQLPILLEQLKVLLRNESFPGSEYDITRIIRALAQAGNLASGIVLFTAKMTKLRAEVIVLTLRYIAAIAFVIAGSTDLTCLGMDQGDLDSVKEWMETFSTRLPKLLNGGELGATQMSTGATATDAGMPRVPPPEFNIAWILVVVLFATKVVIVPKDFVETTLVKHLHNVMQTSDPVSETSVLISNLKKLDQKIDDQAINRMKVPKPATPN